MTHHGNPDPGSSMNMRPYKRVTAMDPVFPGKAYLNDPYPADNLAIQHSLMEIFDEFSQVISGELKSMNLEEFEAEQKPPEQP